MYETFYRLSAMPFQLTPDSRFFYGSRGHSRAIAHLTYGLSQAEGFIVVTGEVGAGKTTLVERLWTELDRDTYTLARVSTTQVSGNDLFRLAMAGFGIEDPAADKATLMRRFEELLRDHRVAGRRCLLVVDEVQNLSIAALEELRMLSNITEDGRASLQTILLGQPQFRAMLASPRLDQLRQRVLASYHLGPLTREETRAYIEHRLTMVGWIGDPAWQPDAFAIVYQHTGGIPRRINRLCSRVLLYGSLEESHEITPAMAESTAIELQHDLEGARGEADQRDALTPPVTNGHDDERDVAEIDRGGPSAGTRELATLLGRIEVLEAQVARRERVFQRLMDVFSTYGAAVR